MKFSSMEITLWNDKPLPLSQLRVTGEEAVRVVEREVQSVVGPGTSVGLTPDAAAQPLIP